MKHFSVFSESELISYIKTRNLGSVAVLILDVLYPFNRIIASILVVSGPILKIFISPAVMNSAISFFENRSSLLHLRKKLLEEN